MTTFSISLDPDEEQQLRAAAEGAGVPIERWMGAALLKAAVSDDADQLAAILDAVTMARFQVRLGDCLPEARHWLGRGFGAAEVENWIGHGCPSPTDAALLRDEGIAPAQLGETWRGSYEAAGTGLTIGSGLSRGLLSVDEVLVLLSDIDS